MKFCFIFICSIFIPLSAIAESADYRALFSALPESGMPNEPVKIARIALGKKLYKDPILSKAQDISCNSCHRLDKFGVDNEPTSPGHLGQRGDRNSPSSFNAFLHIAQFWDGRAKDVEEQALGPVMNPVEMAMPKEDVVVARLKNSAEYPELFKEAFPDTQEPITFEHMGEAIGAFERTLVTPGRFDDYLRGNDQALSEDEKKGLKTFVNLGCNACHSGATLGGTMYQKLGLVKPFPTKDKGRYKVTHKDADLYVFKVPSLRNIAETGPYYHDGSIETLEEAVRLMAKHQLGKNLTKDQVSELVTFLGSLTGNLPESLASIEK